MKGNHTQTMDTIDKFILALYQDTSDLTQKLFGIDNFALAKVTLIISIVTNLFGIWTANNSKFMLGDILNFILLSFLFFVIYSTIIFSEKNTRSCRSINYKNINEIKFRFLRQFQIIMTSFDMISLLFVLMGFHKDEYPHERYVFLAIITIIIDFTFLSCAYFVSCTPKPPTKSKTTQFLEKLGRLLHQEPEPSGI